jgi:hypothetical protein
MPSSIGLSVLERGMSVNGLMVIDPVLLTYQPRNGAVSIQHERLDSVLFWQVPSVMESDKSFQSEL